MSFVALHKNAASRKTLTSESKIEGKYLQQALFAFVEEIKTAQYN